MHISDEFFNVQDIGTVINFVRSFNLFSISYYVLRVRFYDR